MVTSFGCTGCGMCCQKAGLVVEAARYLVYSGHVNDEYILETANFPFSYNETGRCEMLTEDNKCKVYDSRPSICNVRTTWEKYYQSKMTWDQYCHKSAEVCNEMMVSAGIDPSYLINL